MEASIDRPDEGYCHTIKTTGFVGDMGAKYFYRNLNFFEGVVVADEPLDLEIQLFDRLTIFWARAVRLEQIVDPVSHIEEPVCNSSFKIGCFVSALCSKFEYFDFH